MQKTTIYRKPMGENLFEEEFTIEALSQMGNPLEKLSSLVDFEMFRPALEDVLVKKDCKTPAGRPQIDVVLMFKVIFLQRYYGLGDHQIQYQITDRTSFRQFLGIHTVDEVPDEKTVWACKNKLAEDGTFDRLFDEFRTFLDNKGLSFNEGKIIDATFVEAPKQRNTKEENNQISSLRINRTYQNIFLYSCIPSIFIYRNRHRLFISHYRIHCFQCFFVFHTIKHRFSWLYWMRIHEVTDSRLGYCIHISPFFKRYYYESAYIKYRCSFRYLYRPE